MVEWLQEQITASQDRPFKTKSLSDPFAQSGEASPSAEGNQFVFGVVGGNPETSTPEERKCNLTFPRGLR